MNKFRVRNTKRNSEKKVSVCGHIFSISSIDRISPIQEIDEFSKNQFGYTENFEFGIFFYGGSTIFIRFKTKPYAILVKAEIAIRMNIINLNEGKV